MKLSDFMTQEDANFIESMKSQQKIMSYVDRLGSIWDDICRQFNKIDSDDDVVLLSLVQYARTYMNLAFANVLRHHMSLGLAAARNACDATMQAYRIMSEAASADGFIRGDAKFRYTQKWVGEQIKKGEANDGNLDVVHRMFSLFSRYGSHADLGSMFGRITVVTDGDMTIHSYSEFQTPTTEAEMSYLLCTMLATFVSVLEVFWPFILRTASLDDHAASISNIRSIARHVEVERLKHYDAETSLA